MSAASGEPRYPYVAVDVAEDISDDAGATLFELGAQGVEQRDDSTLLKGVGGGKVTLVASFLSHDDAHQAITELPEEWAPRLQEVVGDAWRDEWKKHFHPFEVCPGVVIRPPWEPYENTSGAQVLELEPGRAFGTGLHETTSLVADALRAHAEDYTGGEALDVGCGSGILALIALVLGAKTARGVDVDPEAVEVTRENAMRNDMTARLVADTTDVRALTGAFDVVVANIEAKVLATMAEALVARAKPGKRVVLSGILSGQLEEVKRAFAFATVESVSQKGDWVAVVVRR